MLLRHNEWSPPEVAESPRRRISFLPASIAAWPMRTIVEVVYERCAGLDVQKKSITACVLWALPKGKKRHEKRRFATFTQDLLAMADWLRKLELSGGARRNPAGERAAHQSSAWAQDRPEG